VRHTVAKALEPTSSHRNLFCLQTSYGGTYLFEAPSAKEQIMWMESINRLAALHSAPPLPSPIGSHVSDFIVPAVPSGVTRLDEVIVVMWLEYIFIAQILIA
jgi:Pleckstrin homology domain